MIQWTFLEQDAQWQAVLEESTLRAVVVFKHSTRCFISKMALRNFEASFEQLDTPCYFIDLIAFREISNNVAAVLQVPHASPQLIIVSNKEAFYTASHEEIDGLITRDKLL